MSDEQIYRMNKLVSTVAMEGGGPIPEHELELDTRNSALDVLSDHSLDSGKVPVRARTRGAHSRRSMADGRAYGLVNSSIGKPPIDDQMDKMKASSRTSLQQLASRQRRRAEADPTVSSASIKENLSNLVQ